MMKKPKLISSIRAKLFSAVAMLLVAAIMVVSSTYAWFTLSTAPEVTGMTTAIGANGSLEMALLPKDGNVDSIISTAGDSTKNALEKNVTWGNSVDLSENSIYGLDKIVLLPSALNTAAGGNILGNMILKTPTYGPDGRVDKVQANTQFGNFNGTTSFMIGDEFGVRGVGVASGMTDRQLAYRNAKSTASTNMILAINAATVSLESNGSALANIAIQHAADATAKHDAGDVAALNRIVNDLLGTTTTTGVLEYIEQAYMQYFLMYAAGNKFGAEDLTWKAVQGAVEAEGATLTSVLTSLNLTVETLPEQLKEPITKLQATIANVKSAQTDLASLTGNEFTWDQLKTPLNKLADTSSMKINGFAASEIKAHMNDLVSSVTSQGGLTVEMATGGGVYADVADHCGDYSASITIESVTYGGVTLNNMKARMQTKSTVTPKYLPKMNDAVTTLSAAPSSATAEAKPLTEFYGYIIDLAFRTNAAESDLLLQTEATDRIYGDDNSNDETMGSGSSMTFQATTSSFTNAMVKALMKHVRIVFFTPATTSDALANSAGTVLAIARLDADNAIVGADGLTAQMYLYETVTVITNELDTDKNIYVTSGEGEEATKEIKYYYNPADAQYYSTRTGAGTEAEPYVYTDLVEDIYNATGVTTKTEDRKLTGNEAVITALTQNTATAVSALVYLDGETMTNADVSAEAATSVTGKMNLQFASSANLVPMEYADLHTPATTHKVTLPAAGVVGKETAKANTDYTFTVATGYTLGEVTVAGTAVTPTNNDDGTYTIPADKVTGEIVINATANG